MRRFVRVGYALALAAMPMVFGLSGPVKAASDGAAVSFSAGQVERGEEAYILNCVMCHGYNLNDGEFGPPIKGTFFRNKWAGKSVGELYELTIMTMPQSNPDSLDPETYADILAYVFQSNGMEPGDKDLPVDASALESVPLPW